MNASAAIEKLVLAVAEKSAKSAKNLREQLEALRVLAPYYAALKKGKVDLTTEEPEEISIRSMQSALRKAEDHNGGTVPDNQRRRAETAVEN